MKLETTVFCTPHQKFSYLPWILWCVTLSPSFGISLGKTLVMSGKGKSFPNITIFKYRLILLEGGKWKHHDSAQKAYNNALPFLSQVCFVVVGFRVWISGDIAMQHNQWGSILSTKWNFPRPFYTQMDNLIISQQYYDLNISYWNQPPFCEKT